MIKTLLLPLAAVAAFIVIVGLLVKNSGNITIPGLTVAVATTAPQKAISIGNKAINVEIADTEPKRELGLGGRSFLDSGSGMLFIFDSKNVTPNFWMKNMLIPLDIIWIKGSAVIKIDKNVPAPAQNTPDSGLTIYNAGQPIDYVLEVNAGFSDTNNIEAGTSVNLSNAVK